jgi:hypothetical protein
LQRRRADGGRVGAGDDLGLAQMLGTQRLLDRGSLAGDVASAGFLERGADLRECELGRGGGGGSLRQQFQGVSDGLCMKISLS